MKSARRHHPLSQWLNESGTNRLRSDHPWLFRTNVNEKVLFATDPGVVPLGYRVYFYSPRSEIRLRQFGPFLGEPVVHGLENGQIVSDPTVFEKIWGAALEEHFHQTFLKKKSYVDGDKCFRWLFAESDSTPGLVVDVFDRSVVAQIQSAPIEHFWGVLKKALDRAFTRATGTSAEWSEMRNMPVRKKEGLNVESLPPEKVDAAQWIRWNGFEWWMNPGGPQKTGGYLDQRDNHHAASAWARRLNLKEAWDFCSFEGGFSLHLAKAGLRVEALDQSASALATLSRNAEKNGLRIQTTEADVFDELRRRHQEKRKTDLIVLDPPSFVRSRTDKDAAIRGLKELNLRALHCLNPGGVLVTCTCSHHIAPYELDAILMEASHDSRTRLRVLERRGPAPDHAPLEGFPESNYLQALYLEVV